EMATANLSAKKRTDSGKGAARKLRRAEQIPGIIYGHNREPQMLALDWRELERMLERIAPETTVIELDIDGTTSRTLIREIQRHPFKRQVLHVDFLELVAGERVTVDVPLVLVGTAAGVRNSGGVLDQLLREVTVDVDPSNIPNHIEIDVSALDVNGSLHVSDLVVPAGVEIQDDPDTTVCVVAAPRVEAEPEPAAAEAAPEGAEPELIRKEKEGEEEGE
ncbi:MAG TPA: 50S ribosomal protein L25/general stress protein Ctc, partial [Gemmatimonadaceae bacterium]|nr:50S ribosomal protein L25/general stress protein Ctc [Gemmatimonadaceae bacterium]